MPIEVVNWVAMLKLKIGCWYSAAIVDNIM